MKKLLRSSLIILMIGLFFSCAKKDNPPANTAPTNSMTAKVAGTSWTATKYSAVANSVNITIKGTAADGSYMSFALLPTTTPGTYTLASTGSYTFQYSNSVTSFIVTNGTITITQYTKNSIMTGTFTATVADASNSGNTRAITSGSFSALFN